MGLGALLSEDWVRALLPVAVGLARIAPLMWLVPFLGGRLMPATAKTALALAFSVLLYPVVSTQIAEVSLTWLAALLVKEVFVGLALGFITALVFWAAQSAGWLIDNARGASMSEVLVPTTAARSTPFGSMFFQFAIILFIALGGHRLYIDALASSYQLLPIAHLPQIESVRVLASVTAQLSGEMILLAVTFAAPVIGALVVTELTLGWINRFVPQINVFFLAMPAKAVLGVLGVVLSVGLLAGALPVALEGALAHLSAGIDVLSR